MTDDISNLGGELSKLTGVMQGFEQVLAKTLGFIANFGSKGAEAMKNVGEAGKTGFGSFIQSAAEAGKKMVESGTLFESIANGILDANSLLSNSDIFSQFAGDAKGNLLTVSNAMEALGKQGGLLGKILSEMPGLSIPLAAIEKLGGAASQGQLAEKGFYAMTSAAGQLTEAWGESGNQIVSLGTRTSDYMQKLDTLAVQNRTTIDSTLALAHTMSEVSPGDMDSIVHVGEGVGTTMKTLTAIMQTATGAGRDQTDVTNAISTAYSNLGNAQDGANETNQRGINLFSTMVSLQQSLKIRFDDSRDALNSVAAAFRNVGDETDGAAKIFDTFGKALQNTGISSKASLDITKQMIVGLNDMTVAQKAFLSQQSGGPGGLQGSLQIDEMMRKHDIAGVMNIAQNALKEKFGGRIITQQEGAEGGQQEAIQYQQQRMMVQSGIFGIGKGTDDQTAGRIIEALKQGDVSGMKDTMKSGQDQAGDLAQKGNAIQERNESLLTTAVQYAQRTAIANELNAAAAMRNVGGNGEPLSKVATLLHQQYTDATAELKKNETPVKNMGTRAEAPGDFDRSIGKLKGNTADKLHDAFKFLEDSKKKDEAAQNDTTTILPMNTVSETHKRQIHDHALQTPHTAQMARQALATKEAVSKPTDKDNNIKVMIEVDNKDKGSNVNVSSTAPFSVKQHNGGLNPAPNMPAGH